MSRQQTGSSCSKFKKISFLLSPPRSTGTQKRSNKSLKGTNLKNKKIKSNYFLQSAVDLKEKE